MRLTGEIMASPTFHGTPEEHSKLCMFSSTHHHLTLSTFRCARGRVTKWQPDLLHRNQIYAKVSFHQYFKLLPTILEK
jgi:hypothetical protein